MVKCVHFEGLWVSCFDGFHDKNHQYDVRHYGCKYNLWEEYDTIRDEIQPRKFILHTVITLIIAMHTG